MFSVFTSQVKDANLDQKINTRFVVRVITCQQKRWIDVESFGMWTSCLECTY